jgi:RNA binding exosome subunit
MSEIAPTLLRIESLCHATEDADKVRSLFFRLAPEEDTTTETLYGHHKNPILKLLYLTKKPAEILSFLSKIPDGFVPEIEGKKASIYLRKDSLLDGRWEAAGTDEPAVFIEISFKAFGEGLTERYFLEKRWR